VARDGSLQIWGDSVILNRSGQRVLGMSASGLAYFRPAAAAASAPARPTPRWPDGKPRLGPVPGETGYWGRPSSRFLKENGVNVEIDEDGILKNINDAAKVALFNPGPGPVCLPSTRVSENRSDVSVSVIPRCGCDSSKCLSEFSSWKTKASTGFSS
jgi:hypothetical protein